MLIFKSVHGQLIIKNILHAIIILYDLPISLCDRGKIYCAAVYVFIEWEKLRTTHLVWIKFSSAIISRVSC